MGEVYRARDSRLNRDVAIKVSNAQFTERFAREARAIAALNHTNICHLYDVGPDYLVMEYVEGQDLRGPLDFDDALPIIQQLIDSIEAAHEKNIIHRDLKPANIKITPEGVVKILDFGLAKAMDPPASKEGNPANSPTSTIDATVAGTILGTAAYMAPEQAKGKVADKRSDIWSFGVILYELLTGRRPFQGESVVEILGAVMNKEPDWIDAPAKIQHLLRSCLQKDPKKRLQAMGDARLLLTEPWHSREAQRPRVQAWMAWAAVIILAGLAALGWTRAERPAISPLPQLTLSIVPPSGKSLAPVGGLNIDKISPDGSAVLYRATDSRFHMRRLSSVQDQLIPDFVWAGDPFWAPDSKSIAFPTLSGLMKMQVPNGAPELVTAETIRLGNSRGSSWSEKGIILCAIVQPSQGHIGLYGVPATGGKAFPVEVPGFKEGYYYNPEFLPGGEDFLFAFTSSDQAGAQIFMATLRDGKVIDPRLLFSNDTAAAFTSAGGGRILFVRNDNLYSQKLDVKTRHLVGDPELIEERVVSYAAYRNAYFSVSSSGTVAWRSGTAIASQVVVFDRKGNRIGTAGVPVPASLISLAPNEAHILVGGGVSVGSWVMESNGAGRVSLADVQSTVWSPDGSGVIAVRGAEIVQQSVSGSHEIRPVGGIPTLGERLRVNRVHDVSVDGRRILYSEGSSNFLFSLDAEHRSEPVVEQRVDNAALSPDGAWTVYHPFNEPGIYAQPLASRDLRRQIANRGSGAVWRRDGKEIMYFGGDQNQIWSVRVGGLGAQLRFAAPEPLFSVSLPLGMASGARPLAVSRDGSRIFFLQSTEEPDSGVIQVRTGAIR